MVPRAISKLLTPSRSVFGTLSRRSGKLSCNLHLNTRIEGRIWELIPSTGRRVKVHNIKTDEVFEDTANVVISAKGGLNQIMWPRIKGFGDYKGKLIHSGQWDERQAPETQQHDPKPLTETQC